MNLPSIDIPITLPFELPTLLHPPIVHFAVVLPIVILILELVNIFAKKRAISVISSLALVFLIVVLFGAFFTGKVDGTEAFNSLSKDAKELLKEHKLLGTYLVYGSLVVLLLKILNLTKHATLKFLYILVLIGFVFSILHQGKEGGELVFKHGVNVEAVAELDEKAFDLQEEVDELKEELDELKEELDELKSESKNEHQEEDKQEPTKEDTTNIEQDQKSTDTNESNSTN